MSANWQLLGLCRETDAELFFPVGEGTLAQRQAREAKAVCDLCPVLTTCREWALNRREPHGIWGGMTEQERATHHRRVARNAKAREVRTPESVLKEWSAPAGNGHTRWTRTEPGQISIRGLTYTPTRLAWVVAHGTDPEGIVTAQCGQRGCITAAHLLDAAGRRARHGTPAAYQAHHARGEAACAECREANAAAARQRRHTSEHAAA